MKKNDIINTIKFHLLVTGPFVVSLIVLSSLYGCQHSNFTNIEIRSVKASERSGSTIQRDLPILARKNMKSELVQEHEKVSETEAVVKSKKRTV